MLRIADLSQVLAIQHKRSLVEEMAISTPDEVCKTEPDRESEVYFIEPYFAWNPNWLTRTYSKSQGIRYFLDTIPENVLSRVRRNDAILVVNGSTESSPWCPQNYEAFYVKLAVDDSVFEEVYFFDHEHFKDWTGPEYQGTHLSSWSADDDRLGIVNLLSTFEVVISCHSSELLDGMALLRQRGVITASYLHLFDNTALGRNVGHPMLSVAFEHALDILIGCSQSICDQVRALGVPAEKVVKIANCAGFDLSPQIAKTIMDERSVRDGPLQVLFLGRFDKQKGIDRLISIIAHFNTEKDRVCFRVVGKSTVDQTEQVHKRLSDVEPAVYKAEKLGELYRWADIVLLTSRFEGLPLILIEAMSCGAVPVTTQVGAVGEIIKNDVNGIIVPQANASNDLIEAIEALASNQFDCGPYLKMRLSARFELGGCHRGLRSYAGKTKA